MKVIHTAAELSNEASGPSHSVPNLVYWLGKEGVNVSLEALGPPPARMLDYPQTYHPKSKLLPSLGISPAMKRSLRENARHADIIHTHNLWMMPNIYPLAAARRGSCKLVVSPRGTLTKWARQYRWVRKKAVWYTLQRKVVMRADLIHATSEDELRDLRDLGVACPIALIPNGVLTPVVGENGTESVPGRQRTLLFLGRIHPKKGIEKLLQAWLRVQDLHGDWTLEIVGPDNEGYRSKMERLAEVLRVERCQFKDAVFGNEKSRVYQASSLFVLPTYSDNFAITVAEALSHGVPAVVTQGAPWRGLEEQECGWWVPDGVESIAAALDEAMSKPAEELRRMGMRGRAWVEDAFSWRTIARRMKTTYEWLLGGGSCPAWVDR